MKAATTKQIELNMDELEQLLQRAKGALSEKDYEIVEALVQSYAYVTDLLEDKAITIDRLRKLLFGSGSEKTREVLKDQDQEATAQNGDGSPRTADSEQEPTAPPKGHGRNGADDYEGAERIPVPHPSLRSGDPCPECKKGTVYEQAEPGVLVRITGQAPLHAQVYELQKLRCHLCGKVFTTEAPEGVGDEKYDATAASMIALLKYGTGLPFNRLEGLQGNLGIPLPASTQWDVVQAAAGTAEPVYEELIRQAAQGDVVYNDDTTVKILEFMGKRARQAALEEPLTRGRRPASKPEAGGSAAPACQGEGGTEDSGKKNASQRNGLFTSGIVSTRDGRRIALFFSGRRHAGENLADVLAHRAKTLSPPIQMCDALSRNTPAEFKTILANCLAHGRRQFVEVAERFPEECRYVLETLRDVYRNDAIARERDLSPEQRLAFHQAESGPIMEQLQAWCTRQLDDRLVEPNSALGQAIAYLLNHREKLTLFLHKHGAPLDNNICEQILKRAIVHRKNALFYKTLNGAHVGDIFMSLIHTCQLNDVNPFDYLTELQRHPEELAAQPENWMPWNYRDELRT
jgi:transposase